MNRHISRRAAVVGTATAFIAASSRACAASPTTVPFRYSAEDDALADLKRRLHNMRWPEGEMASDWSQGVPSHKFRALIDYWANQDDWRKTEARLNGGHFAPLEDPLLYVEELRNCFRSIPG